MKLIGLDIGERRIGLAFGDTDLKLATPLDVIVRAGFDKDVSAIGCAIRDYDAEQMVVGLPKNMDGTIGEQARTTEDFARRVAQAIQIPIVFWDERLTTVEATRRTQERETRRGKKARRGLDAVAAAVILQDYMDAQAGESDA